MDPCLGKETAPSGRKAISQEPTMSLQWTQVAVPSNQSVTTSSSRLNVRRDSVDVTGWENVDLLLVGPERSPCGSERVPCSVRSRPAKRRWSDEEQKFLRWALCAKLFHHCPSHCLSCVGAACYVCRATEGETLNPEAHRIVRPESLLLIVPRAGPVPRSNQVKKPCDFQHVTVDVEVRSYVAA